MNNKNTWDSFVTRAPFYTFFHSWAWGDFSSKTGEQVLRYGIFEAKKLVGVALVIKVSAKRGTYLFCPHGPIFTAQKAGYWNFFLKFIKERGVIEKVDFVRVSPVLEELKKNQDYFKKAKFINAPIHMSAENSWILDLRNKNETVLLSQMRKTTRYEIRKAQKLGFKVIKSVNPKDLKIFLNLYHHTVDRTNFVPFSDKYIVEEFLTFAKDNCAMLFLEKHHQKFVAAVMVMFFGKGAYYHQGATQPRFKEAVSYLAQWEAILEAKKRGCSYYNFWGIAPTDSKKHPWYGLSLFKKGFGGQQINFVHAQDYPIKLWRYIPAYLLETGRRIRRGF